MEHPAIIRIFGAGFLIFLLSGCVTAPEEPITQLNETRKINIDFPEWVTNHPFEKGILFGIGNDRTRDAALQKAIVAIGQQLQTQVIGNVLEKSNSDQSVKETIAITIDEQITNTTVQGARVQDDYHTSNGDWWVLVRKPLECEIEIIQSALISYKLELDLETDEITDLIAESENVLSVDNLTLYDAVASTYSGEHLVLGGAVKEHVFADLAIVVIEPVPNGNYSWSFGDIFGNTSVNKEAFKLYSRDIQKYALTLQEGATVKLVLSGRGQSREFVLTYWPDKIHSWQDLQAMRLNPTATYTLMHDIEFPDNDGDGRGDYNFEPIGYDISRRKKYLKTPFSGIFEGNEHTIDRLNIDRPDLPYVGLFGKLDRKTRVSNVNLDNVYINGKRNAGALAGYTVNKNNVKNASYSGEIVMKNKRKGRLVGYRLRKNIIAAGGGLNAFLGANKDYIGYDFQLEYERQFNEIWSYFFNFGFGLPLPSYVPADKNYTFYTGLRLSTPSAPISVFLQSGVGVNGMFADYTLADMVSSPGFAPHVGLGMQLMSKGGLLIQYYSDFFMGVKLLGENNGSLLYGGDIATVKIGFGF